MQKKKVLMCYHSSQFGGVEKHILDIIEGLSKEFDFIVVCPNGPLVKEYLKAGAIKHIDLIPKFEADFSYSIKIKKIIKDENIEIIHSHELLSGSLATFGGWLASCKKRIYHVHTSFTEWQYSTLKKYPALLINTIVNFVVGNIFATDVIALTESVKSVRTKKEFINSKKIRVIPNGLYLDEFKFDEQLRNKFRKNHNINDNEFVIGNIARFTAEKGQELLVQAFKLLVEKNPQKKYKLMFAGSGILEAKIKSKVEEFNLKDKVVFLGRFDDSDKVAILSSFDSFVFPSYAEGFGIALLEAMAVGVPTIASDLEVLKDVGEDSIMYFEKGNFKDLEDKLSRLSKNNELLRDLKEKGRDRSKAFSMQQFWEAYSKLYRN